MFKKVLLSISLAVSVIAAPVYALPEIYLGQANGVEFILPPNESQIFTNVFMWTINANCEILCDKNEVNTVYFKVLKKTGSLNGMSLKSGDSMNLDLHSKDEMLISSSPGSKVELKNIGRTTIHAYCNLVS